MVNKKRLTKKNSGGNRLRSKTETGTGRRWFRKRTKTKSPTSQEMKNLALTQGRSN